MNHLCTSLLLSLLAVGATPVSASQPPTEDPPQTAPASGDKPQNDPSLTDPSIDDDLITQRRSRVTPSRVPPSTPKSILWSGPTVPEPQVPGLRLTDQRLPARRVYPEGTFITFRQGELIRTPADDLVFLPKPASPEEADREPPMLLLACQRSAQIAAAMDQAQAPITLSGQVFVYRGRHHILPNAFSFTQPAPPGAEPTVPAPEAGAPVANATDPRVEELIADLERDQGTPRALDPRSAVTTTPEGGPESTLLPEGTLVVARRGRLTRLPNERGQVAFAFDNDPNSPAVTPVMILPCRMLQSLELLVATRGEDLVLRMSGRTTAMDGRNYILPTLFQVSAPSDITPMQ